MMTSPLPSPHSPRPIDLLLRQLGLDHLPGDCPPGASYLLTIGDVDIELVDSARDGLTLQCYPGLLSEPTIATLSILLAENHSRDDLPLISVHLLAEAPANVHIWSHLTTADASADRLVNWFLCFSQLAQAMHGWLDAGAPEFSFGDQREPPRAMLH